MARPRLNDLMQQHPFWVFDAGILGGNVLFPTLDPSLAFSSVTAPEITVEEREVKTGNWQFSRRYIKSASVGPIVLSRGTRFYDSDMYNWITAAILGKDPVRRSLCLMHFLGRRSGGQAGQIIGGALTGALSGLQSGGVASVAQGAVGGAIVGSFINDRIPGRMWMLHDCLDDETEILGENGWLGIDDVTDGMPVYGMNMVSGGLELVPIDACVRRSVDAGEMMVGIAGRHGNFRITDNHGVYLRQSVTGTLKRVTAGELFEMSGAWQIPVSGRVSFPGVELSDDELRLIAWFVTDGCMKDGQRVIISQSKPHKDEIRELLRRLGLAFTERIAEARGFKNGKPIHHFGIPKGMRAATGKGWISYADFLDKDISPLLHRMTREQFVVFWNELVKGDGSRPGKPGGSQLWCSRRTQADALMQMGVLRGFGMSWTESVTKNGHTMYCLYPTDREWMHVRPNRLRTADRPLTRAPADPGEEVWCVSNRLGTLVTRRGGRVTILGNCIPMRYKAGTDFDASSGAVSIQELEVQPEHIVEVTVSTLSGVQGAIGSVKGAIKVVEAF